MVNAEEIEVVAFHVYPMASKPRKPKVRFVTFDPSASEHARTRGKIRICFICRASKSPSWRKGLNGETLCNKLSQILCVVDGRELITSSHRCGLRETRRKMRSMGASAGLLVNSEETSSLPKKNVPKPEPLSPSAARQSADREQSTFGRRHETSASDIDEVCTLHCLMHMPVQ
jgi:hypothetical protein